MSYSNGQIPLSALKKCTTGLYLRADAAASYERMAKAFNRVHGPMYMTDAYRDLATQKRLKKEKGSLAAAPGTSNHGWGIAVDFASRINISTSVQHQWMDRNASEYGWVNPLWARDNVRSNGEFEPWHWEYVPALDKHAGGTLSQVPAFPLKAGYYFGPASGGKFSISGFYSNAADFKVWQTQMKKRGWKINPDGKYGAESRKVIIDFQTEKGLEPDGRVGPATWRAAWTAPITPA